MSVEPPLSIAKTDGSVVLPNGMSIDSGLTREQFQKSTAAEVAECHDYGIGWLEYQFSGGQIEGHNLATTLVLYEQSLAEIDLVADLYPPGPRDWSTQHSSGIEVAIKDLHERLLNQLFGRPQVSHPGPVKYLARQSPLDDRYEWVFPWGRVGSLHDDRNGESFIRILYGTRREVASRAAR